jgi:hypothetical protein
MVTVQVENRRRILVVYRPGVATVNAERINCRSTAKHLTINNLLPKIKDSRVTALGRRILITGEKSLSTLVELRNQFQKG